MNINYGGGRHVWRWRGRVSPTGFIWTWRTRLGWAWWASDGNPRRGVSARWTMANGRPRTIRRQQGLWCNTNGGRKVLAGGGILNRHSGREDRRASSDGRGSDWFAAAPLLLKGDSTRGRCGSNGDGVVVPLALLVHVLTIGMWWRD
jgi:hypothetical protein